MSAKTYVVTQGELDRHSPCKYCKAPIVWYQGIYGSAVALDAKHRKPYLMGGWTLDPHWAYCTRAGRAPARKGGTSLRR